MPPQSPLLFNRREQFVAEHTASGEPRVQITGVWYFADGAVCDLDVLTFTPDDEPPTDPLYLARRKVIYWTERRKRASDEFDSQRKELLERANVALKTGDQLPPSKDDLDQLKLLQTKVQSCQRMLEQVEQERIAAIPQRVRDAAAIKARNRSLAGEFLGQIRDIQV